MIQFFCHSFSNDHKRCAIRHSLQEKDFNLRWSSFCEKMTFFSTQSWVATSLCRKCLLPWLPNPLNPFNLRQCGLYPKWTRIAKVIELKIPGKFYTCYCKLLESKHLLFYVTTDVYFFLKHRRKMAWRHLHRRILSTCPLQLGLCIQYET